MVKYENYVDYWAFLFLLLAYSLPFSNYNHFSILPRSPQFVSFYMPEFIRLIKFCVLFNLGNTTQSVTSMTATPTLPQRIRNNETNLLTKQAFCF